MITTGLFLLTNVTVSEGAHTGNQYVEELDGKDNGAKPEYLMAIGERQVTI